MTTANSTAQGYRGLGNVYGEGGHGGYSGPRAAYDDNTPAGVDPEGLWRFSNTSKYRRTGATTAERAGAVPGYTPGYGRSSNRNATGGASSLTPQAQWDDQFRPHLGPQMDQQRHGADYAQANEAAGNVAGNAMLGLPSGAQPSPAVLPVLPLAATPAPIAPTPPATPSPGSVGQVSGHPVTQYDASNGVAQRIVSGLPKGQQAGSSFVPGQNTPKNLATRTRPPVDPLAS